MQPTQCHLEVSMYACGTVHGQHGGGAWQGHYVEVWCGQQCCVDGGCGEEQLTDRHGGQAADEPHLRSSVK